MKLVIAILVSLLLNVGLAFIGQGRFLVDVLILAVCIWIAAPLFLFSVVFLAIACRKRRAGMIAFGQWAMLASLVLGSTTASLYWGGVVNRKGVDAAKAYCEQVAIRLDAIKAQDGAYPTNMAEFVRQSELPRILKGGNLYYHSQGTNYSLTFSDLGGLMTGWDFSGNTKQWSRWD